MGVIGRLDDQVDEVIIKPVGERNRQENTEDQARPLPSEEPPRTEARRERTKDEEADGARPQDLPVWLL